LTKKKKSTIKLTVNVPSESLDQLKGHSLLKGITMTEGINRALGLKNFLDDEVLKGGKILIRRRNGDYHEVIWD